MTFQIHKTLSDESETDHNLMIGIIKEDLK